MVYKITNNILALKFLTSWLFSWHFFSKIAALAQAVHISISGGVERVRQGVLVVFFHVIVVLARFSAGACPLKKQQTKRKINNKFGSN